MTKEIREQERSYKSRLAAQEKHAHENWVAARQLERRLEESKQEGAQLRQRMIQVEKEKEILLAKENGTTVNGASDPELHKPINKRKFCQHFFSIIFLRQQEREGKINIRRLPKPSFINSLANVLYYIY